jgi:chromosome segregation ATPase
VDRQALDAYRRRLADLDEELDEADAWADRARAERLATEREALLAQVREATGLAGRLRAPAGARERARVSVRKAIAAALDRIAEADPGLARLLRDTVTTGGVCRYDPDPGRPVRWVLTP